MIPPLRQPPLRRPLLSASLPAALWLVWVCATGPAAAADTPRATGATPAPPTAEAADPALPPADTAGFPRRKPGLWLIESSSDRLMGLPAPEHCIDEDTDNDREQLGRRSEARGPCTSTPYHLVGGIWVAETVCREQSQTVINQATASGDFDTRYQVETIVLYSPPVANHREDVETQTGTWKGPCPAGMEGGDIRFPGMGTLNLRDGSTRSGNARP